MGGASLAVGLTGTGLMPGDPAAISFARLLLLPGCYRLWQSAQGRPLVLRTFVDGLRLRAATDTGEEAATEVATKVLPSLEGFETLSNTFPLSKSLAMGSTAGVRKILGNILSSAGWNLRQAHVCKDL